MVISMKALISWFNVKKGKGKDFENFIKDSMNKSKNAKGNAGAILFRASETVNRYAILGFWESRDDWSNFLDKVGAREAVKPYVQSKPKSEWFETLSRLQKGELVAKL